MISTNGCCKKQKTKSGYKDYDDKQQNPRIGTQLLSKTFDHI